jgi:serine phosphatase RsbU (regulator of sigma subunit)
MKTIPAGLRRKVYFLLLAILATVLLVSFTFGRKVMHDLAADLSRDLAVAEAQLTREKIQALVGRELAIAQRFAGLSALENWLIKEQDDATRTRFLAEAMGFQRAFADRAYFVIHHRSLAYYYADAKSPSARFRYTLDQGKPEDAWYFSTMNHPVAYTLNVNPDATLKVTNLWINVQIRNAGGLPLGLVGTGMQLDRFLKTMLAPRTTGSICFIVDARGRIVAHPDPERIEYGAIDSLDTTRTLFAELRSDQDREAAARALKSTREAGEEVVAMETAGDGRRLMAFAHLPELDWTVVSSVDPSAAPILSSDFSRLALISGIVILILLTLAVHVGFDRLVLHPLLALTESALRVASGHYDIRLDSERDDEIGELSRAFDTMAAQVQAHTETLEQRVAERTAQLESTHAELAATHRQLTESIRYASLIQQVILPDRELRERLHGSYFVLWQPRDVVGGDFYLFRERAEGCLFGVIDCAGHGVPGAFMTMIAHAALERATLEQDWRDPAALLEGVDRAVRGMLPDTRRLERLATSMDIGLCFVEYATRRVHFAGAHIDLLVATDDGIRHVRGDRNGINVRAPRPYRSQTLDLDARSVFYLVTDGILDQSGGDRGLPFGRGGFTAWLEDHSRLPLPEQEAALTSCLNAFRGTTPQRDDITVLAFTFESTPSDPRQEALA